MRTLSSAQTFLMKVLFPVVWISGFGFGTLSLWLAGAHEKGGVPPSAGMKWEFLAAWMAGTAFILWGCAPLKRVRVDSTHLHLSNFLREISVPLDLIENVTEVRWINIHPVTVHFRAATEFGHRITFMPKARVFALWSSHPVVAELMRLAGRNPNP